MRRRDMIAFAVAVLCATALLRGASVHSQSAPPLITIGFGPQQVFALPPAGLLQIEQQCPPADSAGQPDAGSAACVMQYMQQNGASADAIAFYRLSGHILLDYQPYGPVDLGTVTYDIWCCTADTSDTEPVLLGGTPALISPLDVFAGIALDQYAGYADAVAAFPQLSELGLDGAVLEQVTASPEQGQRFIFDMRLNSGCRACGTGYAARLAFDFDADGSYIAAVPLDIACLQEATKQFGCAPQ